MLTLRLVEWIAARLPRREILSPSDTPYLDRYYVAGDPRTLRLFPKGTRSRLGWLPWTIYLHHFRTPDWHRSALHDHPSDGVSLILTGGYIEERLAGDPEGEFSIEASRRGIGAVTFVGCHTWHRIERLLGRPTWTLFITGPKRKSWSFFVPEWPKTVPWREFIESQRSTPEVTS